MQDNTRTDAVPQPAPHLGKLRTFTREHPALSAVGLAGIGLLGGFELAAGMLIGAGVATALRRRDGNVTQAAREREPGTHPMRDRARSLLDRAQRVVRERARAVVDAARGKGPMAPSQPPAS